MRRQVLLSALTFGAVLFLVLSFFYWSQYRRDEAAQAAVISRVSEMRRALAEVTLPEGDPKKDLASAQERLERARQVLPPPPDGNVVVRRILELGNQNMLRVVPLVVDEPGTVEVGRHRYGVLGLSITVKGYYRNLLDFVKALGGIESAVVIDSLTVTRGAPAEVAAAPQGEVPVVAVIEMSIYSQVQGGAGLQGGVAK